MRSHDTRNELRVTNGAEHRAGQQQRIVLREVDRRAATIEGVAELELEPIANPVTGAQVHPEIVLPEGLVVNRASLAASKVFRVGGGPTYEHSGKYAAFAAFSYRS